MGEKHAPARGLAKKRAAARNIEHSYAGLKLKRQYRAWQEEYRKRVAAQRKDRVLPNNPGRGPSLLSPPPRAPSRPALTARRPPFCARQPAARSAPPPASL